MHLKRILFIVLFISAVISQAQLYNLGGFWKGTGTPEAQWAWMSGTKNYREEPPVYGTMGVAAAANTPGARTGVNTWRDSSGNLWLYGGNGPDVNLDYGRMSDLWKYDISTNQWAWIGGSQVINVTGNYGTKGVAAGSNWPGRREFAFTWSDTATNTLWLFGGVGDGYMSDLWSYNISTGQWTWVHGPNSGNEGAVPGTQGVGSTANNPGGRGSGATWYDGSGNLWLFGGNIYGSMYNDIWKYTPSNDQWTWLRGETNSGVPTPSYGTKGTEVAGNEPPGRTNIKGWVDASGNLWFFGGEGSDFNISNYGKNNDFWRYNPSNNRWTWMAGSDHDNEASVPGTQGVPSTSNIIGARRSYALWKDTSGVVWIFGGNIVGTSGCDWENNDVWKFNPSNNQVTWVAGDPNCADPFYKGTPGTKGTGSTSNLPSARYDIGGVWQDASNNFYLYGGSGSDSVSSSGWMNDVWRFNATSGQWTWLSGNTVIPVNSGTYGTKGTSSASNEPGARRLSRIVADTSGNLFLLGGEFYGYYRGCFGCGYSGLMKYTASNNQWAWISGTAGLDDGTYSYSGSDVFGTKGTPSTANGPGHIEAQGMDIDSSGMIWVFGGRTGANGIDNNNLWKYNPGTNQWTWVSGSGATYDVSGNYGTKGVSSPTNLPGSRLDMAFKADNAGNLWMFGGRGYDESGGYGFLNDLWKYNTTSGEWTWMAGSKTVTQNGVYGTLGVANASNTPGSRSGSKGFSDGTNFFIFGGYGRDSVNSYDEGLSDTWKFDGSNWTWVHGPNTSSGGSAAVVYGTKGIFASVNNPGGRDSFTGFQGPSGYFYILGGWANDTSGSGTWQGSDSLFRYDHVINQWSCIYACSDAELNQNSVYGTKGTPAPTNVPGNRPSSAGAIDRFGTIWLYGGAFGPDTQLWRFK